MSRLPQFLGLWAGMVVTIAVLQIEAAEVRRVGFLLPPDEPDREALRAGAEAAVRLWNASPTNAGRWRLELVVRGKPGQWGDDGDEAGRLVMDDGVLVLIAPPGGAASHLALQVAGRTRTPVISLCSDGSVVGAGIPWMVRLVPSTEDEARLLMAGGGNWIAWVMEGRGGREVRRDLEAAARAVGATVEVRIWKGEGSGGTMNAGVRGALVWLPPNPALHVVRELREAGWKGILAGPGTLRCRTFDGGARESAEGFRIVEIEPGPASAAARRTLAEAMSGATGGGDPEPSAARGADAVWLAAEWLVRSEGRAITSLFPPPAAGWGVGTTGAWQFGPNGARRCRMSEWEWARGSWVARRR